MNKQEIMNALNNVKSGTYQVVVYKTNLTPNRYNKGCAITKVVRAVVRFGVQYSHLSELVAEDKARKAAGLEPATHELKNAHWINKYLIQHDNGNILLRITVSKGVFHKSRILGYYKDGQPISEAEARECTQASQWTPRNTPLLVFSKKIDDIISIGKVGE